jgi:hypothetical protein
MIVSDDELVALDISDDELVALDISDDELVEVDISDDKLVEVDISDDELVEVDISDDELVEVDIANQINYHLTSKGSNFRLFQTGQTQSDCRGYQNDFHHKLRNIISI